MDFIQGSSQGSGQRSLASGFLNRPVIGLLLYLHRQSHTTLSAFLEYHGMTTGFGASRESLCVSLMRHFLKGDCYMSSSEAEGCACQRRKEPDCLSFLRGAFTAILTHSEDGIFQMHEIVCQSLGLDVTHFDRASRTMNMKCSIKKYVECFLTSEDDLSALQNIETYRLSDIYPIMAAHRIQIPSGRVVLEDLRSLLVKHIATHQCHLNPPEARLPSCVRVASFEDYGISILRKAVSKGIKKRPLQRLVTALEVPIEGFLSLSLNQLRSAIYLHIRQAGKTPSASCRPALVERERVLSRRDYCLQNWPQIVDADLKDRLQHAFVDATSSSTLKEEACAVCGGCFVSNEMYPDVLRHNEIKSLDLLRLPETTPNLLRAEFVRDDELNGLALDKSGLHRRGEEGLVIKLCKVCHKFLVNEDKMPPFALANSMILGSIPPELQDLTVVEEALIARRRAKMWVIHLRGDTDDGTDERSSIPGVTSVSGIEQKGLRGHVVVYNADARNLASCLPPSLDNSSVPVCVVFVGSSEPTREWLLEKARPLIIRTEKVRAALIWLKQNNPLYKDIIIDHDVLDSWPAGEHLFPATIQVQAPTHENTNEGSRYDQSSCEMCGRGPEQSCQCDSAHTTEFFQNVVVSDIEVTTATSAQMTTAALKHLKSGKGFIKVGHEAQFANSYTDEHLFPLLYPTLFPYGCGGFELSTRRVKVDLRAQARHYFRLADRRFQTHYSFLFTVFNILQRRAVNEGARLKVKQDHFNRFASEYAQITSSEIDEALAYHQSYLSPQSSREFTPAVRKVENLLKHVNLVSTKVAGTTASRLKMRNEIRGMMMDLGLPSFFITINPADVYSPVIRVLAGEDIDIDAFSSEGSFSYRDQAVKVARNPFIGAKFFDSYMKAFFKHLIGDRWENGNEIGGLLGHATGYYGCVEAQGRGTLHCHMLIWLDGSLDPHEICERILNRQDFEFKDRLVAFIDDVIHNGIPELPSESATSCVPSVGVHPCSRRPLLRRAPGSERVKDMHNLVRSCQCHCHRKTCFKYDKQRCRFDLDPDYYIPVTSVSRETGELIYRILNGMVNNYNPEMLEVLRCNMDIKFVGSGVSAKGILYYITDYITKSPLKTDAAYAALQQAIKRLEEGTSSHPLSDLDKAKMVLIKCANQMIARQQLSAPQVSSYLMGYGDHYTNHVFRSLYWPSFESYIVKSEESAGWSNPEPSNHDQTDSLEGALEDETQVEMLSSDEVLLSTDDNSNLIPLAGQCADYIYRSSQLNSVCLWDFVAEYEKRSLGRLKSMAPRAFAFVNDELPDNFDECRAPNDDSDDSRFVLGSKYCLLPHHPQSKSHALHHRRKRCVPVPTGPGLPRRDRAAIWEKYCRVMLILFKPWKGIKDLRNIDETWTDAFERFQRNAPCRILKFMDNMQRLHECKDSRDVAFAKRRLNMRGENMQTEGLNCEPSSECVDLQDDIDLGAVAEELRTIEATKTRKNNVEAINFDNAINAANDAGLFEFEQISRNTLIPSSPPKLCDPLTKSLERRWKSDYETRVQVTVNQVTPDERDQTELATSSTLNDSVEPIISMLNDHATQPIAIMTSNITPESSTIEAADLIKTLCAEHNLNEEQALAFKIIAESSFLPRSEPLRMFMGGPGGTGKSTVIATLTEFFDRRKQSYRLKKGAITGVAAKHIGGSTLHALLSLRKISRERDEDPWKVSGTVREKLRQVWKNTDFLFIDEVSMVGCIAMDKINAALRFAKSCEEPFGGINIVFAGDFCQMAPVADSSLYSSAHKRPSKKALGLTQRKLETAAGRLLWLNINESIIFHRQMRQMGAQNMRFRELLARLRNGACTEDDYEILSERVIGKHLNERARFRDAPIITSLNAVKDELSKRIAKRYAFECQLEYCEYFASDLYKGSPITDTAMLGHLDSLHSGQTSHLLSRLPLFPGMPVYLVHNYDVAGGIVNGSDGFVKQIHYEVSPIGHRVATSVIVTIPEYNGPQMEGLGPRDVAVFPETKQILIFNPTTQKSITIERTQLPLQPAFTMTEYKAQGRTLNNVIIDLAGCSGSQAPYVMASRATCLSGLYILRPFDIKKIRCRPSEDLRLETLRLDELYMKTLANYSSGETRVRATKELEAVQKRRLDLETQRAARQPLPKRRRKTQSDPIDTARFIVDMMDQSDEDPYPS
jgi:hypothetical protein